MKKLLYIYNPHSGSGNSARCCSDVVDIFTKAGYETTVYPTQSKGDCTRYARENMNRFEAVAVSGGDGMLHEIINAVALAKEKVPLIYIPSGTVNDFAVSNGIPRDLTEAARLSSTGAERLLDVGCFNGEAFSYVAAFGFGTGVAYRTDQQVKQRLGVLAYVIEIIKSIDLMHMEKACSNVKVTCGDKVIEGQFIFGAVTNSKSVAGMPNLVPQDVVLDDGIMEGILIRRPNNIIELDQIKNALLKRTLECPLITCLKGSEFKIEGTATWTLDGEDGGTCDNVEITTLHKALKIIV